jgi:hypothetical protein
MKGHLEERGETVWRLKVFVDTDINGKKIFKSHTVHCGKPYAQKALAKFVTEVTENRIGLSDPRLTLMQYLERFQKVRKANVARRTWVISESLIRLHINPNIGHLKLQRVSDKDVTIPPPESIEKVIKATKPIRMAITIMVSNRSVTSPDSLVNALRDYRQWQRQEYSEA